MNANEKNGKSFNPQLKIQGDQKRLCAPDDYSTKTCKNILNSFNHLP
jgi:hypothetical protein